MISSDNLTNYEFFMLYGVDIENRVIYQGSASDNGEGETGTDFEMGKRFIKGMTILNNISDKPIEVIMNNPGGCEYHGMAIYDMIKEHGDVTITVRGHAMSMGSIILMAGAHRRMSAHSRIMLHYGTSNHTPDDHTKNSGKIQEEAEKFNAMMEDIFLEKIRDKISENEGEGVQSNILPNKPTRQWLQKKMMFDWFIDADTALEIGLIDEIIED